MPSIFFFASVWRIIFSPLLTLLKICCLQLQKSPSEEQKKTLAYLQTLMQMNLLGANQEIIFLFLIPCRNSFLGGGEQKNNNNNKCGKKLNDYIKINETTVSRKELNQWVVQFICPFLFFFQTRKICIDVLFTSPWYMDFQSNSNCCHFLPCSPLLVNIL